MYQKLLLLIYVFVNIALYAFSYDGAAFIEGADASQYYVPALSFLETGQFMVGDDPLTFGPPLYSIFLSIPIGIFGIEDSSIAIVILQTALLFFTGYIFKLIFLAIYKKPCKNKYAFLLHALVIFNPNSLITAHLVQSETLFTFLFSIALFFSVKIISNYSFRNLIFIGLFLGLATLTRSVGWYLLIAWPLIMFVVIVFFSDNKSINKIKLFTPFLAGLIVISPWYVRNYVNFEDIFYTSNAGVYLQLQYIQLQHKGSGWSRDQGEKEYNKYFSQYLQNRSVEEQELCLNHQRDWFCNEALSSHAINMITSEPPVVHLRALMDSWLTLFLAGGASNYRNYLGIDGKNVIVGFQRRAYKGIDSIIYLVKEMNFPYFFIFVLTTLFTIFTRLIGVIGLFVLFRDRKLRLYGVLLFEVISIFTAAYLYLGQSRFRVPLEPMLMLLTVVGIVYLVSRSKVKNT